MIADDIVERLLARIEIDPDTGCWRYGNAVAYGTFWDGEKTHPVHRVAYRIFHGEIPEGHDVDHVWAAGCRHQNCCHPDHLEAVTPAENGRRAAATRGELNGTRLRGRRRKVDLGEDLDDHVRRLADQYKVSEVDVIRMAVAAYVTRGEL